MAKIKSTLDLVMERTKNISISQEEKEALRRKEWTEKAMVWVRKVMDRKMTLAEMKSSLESGMAEYPAVREILKDELISQIDPDEDNESVFEALREVLGVDAEPFRRSILEYHERLGAVYAENMERSKSELGLQGISGSAVVPNLGRDETWARSVKTLRAELGRRLKGI